MYPATKALERMAQEIVAQGNECSPVPPASMGEGEELGIGLLVGQSFPFCTVTPYVSADCCFLDLVRFSFFGTKIQSVENIEIRDC